MLLVEERHQSNIIQTLSSSSKGLAYWTCLQGLDYHHRKCIIGEYASKHHHLHHYHGISSLDIAIRDKTSSSLLCTCVLTSSSSSFAFFVSLQTVYCSCKRETQNIFKQQPSVEDSDLFWCKMRTVYELRNLQTVNQSWSSKKEQLTPRTRTVHPSLTLTVYYLHHPVINTYHLDCVLTSQYFIGFLTLTWD